MLVTRAVAVNKRVRFPALKSFCSNWKERQRRDKYMNNINPHRDEFYKGNKTG